MYICTHKQHVNGLGSTSSDSLSDLGLDGAGDARIADAEQAAGGRARGEPVTASQPLH